MSEKQIKVLTLLGKVSGLLTAASAKIEFIPEKYAIVGVIVAILASTIKDTVSWLGDLWDDGKLNKSYKP
jgi:hypothetical protein